MGREIRRVPPGWEHPKKENGDNQPMFDQSLESAIEEWEKNKELWDKGEHPDQEKYDDTPEDYREWAGQNPAKMPEYYRPEFEEEPTAFQVYETVTKGTPVSPVFETKEEMKKWLINEQGLTEEQADEFIEEGWAPTFIMTADKAGNKTLTEGWKDTKTS